MRIGRIFILLLTFVYMFSDMNATTPRIPDFSFPKKVSAQSERDLSTALATNDGPAITRALIDYYLAQTRISEDNTLSAIAKIEAVATTTSDPVLKAILSTLEARIYNSVYQNQRWKFDQRNLPLTPLPENYAEWSGSQFIAKINALLDRALLESPALKNTPIKTYSSVIDLGGSPIKRTLSHSRINERETQVYYPTLYDFVAYRAITTYRNLAIRQSFLAWGLLTRHDLYVSFPFNSSDPNLSRILQLYGSLLSFHRPGTAPFINTDLQRIQFIASHIYETSDNNRTLSTNERKRTLLRDLYDENTGTEYSGDILLALEGIEQDTKWYFNTLNHNISAYPAYSRINNLRNIVRTLSRQTLSVKLPSETGPGMETKFDVEMKNVKSGKIYIYNVSTSPVDDDGYQCTGLPAFAPTAVLSVESSQGSVPFKDKKTMNFTFPKAGCYIAIPVIDGIKPKERKWHRKIRVSEYSVAASGFDKTTIWGLDAKTGAPVADAKITLIDNRQAKQKTIGTTASDGSLTYDYDGHGYVSISKNGDKYAPWLWIYRNNDREQDKWTAASNGYTSLPLYHPGDSVDWMAICYEYLNDSRRPIINREVEAILRNPSGVKIDTVMMTTDSFGRINGKFAIPKEGLAGIYYISVNGRFNSVSFEVSDYKLPTFRVILDPVESDVPSRGDATLRGRLETYAGFPVGNAKLTVKLSASQRLRWWYGSNPVDFHTFEATSSPDGKIEITIPKDILDLSPLPGGVFTAEVAAMSSTGETQTASTMFSQGQRYIIRLSAPANIDISHPTTAVKVQVVNYLDSVVAMPVDYSLMRDSDVVLKGTLPPSANELDLTSLPSGKYELCVSLSDSTLAEPAKQDVTLYRPTDSATPSPGQLLWYPTDKVTVRNGITPTWLYAVDCPTNLLVTLHTDTDIISREWIKADEGMHSLPIVIPDSIDKARLEIHLTGNYRNASATVNILRDKPEKGIRFITESFRNRVIPGTEETWSFRVVDESGDGKKSAVILDMYNTALDALASQSWTFNPTGWKFSRNYYWNQSQLAGMIYADIHHYHGERLSQTSPVEPGFNTYGLPLTAGDKSFYALDEVVTTGKVYGYSSRAPLSGKAAGIETQVVNTSAMRKNSMIAADYADDAIKEEAAVEEEVSSDTGGAAPEESEPAFSFRDNEVPVAFFQPTLVTDENGRLTFSFTVPNANTTWGFRALAYTDSLLATNFSADVLANKPVMVQPNLPRFLRAGDKAIVKASVMNSSDAEQSITTHVEIFSAADGKTIKDFTQTDVLAPNTAAIVDIEIDAPSDAPFIGYRIKATGGDFADGEQTLLPVLPAESQVIDTYPFYIAPDGRDFSMDLPPMPENARATLQFCNNPTWYVVTALPGILDIKASTANEAAASIFSAAVASGLLRDNPAIAEAIDEWKQSDRSDETLTSMLERNADLKQVLLSATPWMLDARNDSERMARLSLLFDKKTVENTMKTNIATLKKLACNEGGWAWFSSYNKPSLWATENVLLMMGDLYRMGYLPESSDLRSMIISSLRWIDAETAKDFNEYPDADYSLYVLLRDRFNDFKGAPAVKSAIISATVQRILADWKKGSVFTKAIDAQILAAHSYRNVASTILESLREYSEYTPTKGMWWPSLDNMTIWSMGKIGTTAIVLEAFAAVEPQCDNIDRIRQWLILQKEAKDWGTSVTTTQTIASILSTSKAWIKAAGDAKISLDGKEVKPDKIERLTGYFRSPVEWGHKKGAMLEVTRKGDSPAWGSLHVMYTDSMTSVKASSCPEIAIEKTLILNTVDAQGKPQALTADSLKIGDRLSVTLTLHVDRDMDYVTIVDERPACYEPADQLPTPLFAEGLYFYRENRDSETRLFIDHLPKGTYILTYDVWVNNAGDFVSGLATVQSQYAPQFTAHTGGRRITVK